MNFEVETGAGSATATSYATVAQYKSYWADFGTTIEDSNTSIQGYLNLATEYLDNTYNFQGDVAKYTQALRWPRANIYDKFGFLLPYTTIPNAIIHAVCYLGMQAKKNLLMSPDYGVKQETFGPVSKTYRNTSNTVDFPYINRVLKDYLAAGGKLQRVN